MKNINYLILSLSAACFLTCYSASAQFLLTTEADAQVMGNDSNGSGTFNVGGRTDVGIRKAGFAGGNYTAYIRFNLSGLTNIVDNAELRLTLNLVTSSKQDFNVYVLNDNFAGGADEGGDPEQGESWGQGNRNWAVATTGQINGDRAPAFNELNGSVVTSKASLVGSLTLQPSATGTAIYFSSQALLDAINNDTNDKLTIIIAGGTNCNIQVRSKEATGTENAPTLEYTYVGPKTPVSAIAVTPIDTALALNANVQLKTTIAPAGASKKVTWSSSDPSIASVNASGLVSALKIGVATITATAVDGGLTATCKITSGLFIRDNEFDGPDDAPLASELYSRKPELSGSHPRLMFNAYPLSTMKARIRNPNYASIWKTIKANAKAYSQLTPPAALTGNEINDRARTFYLDWMALAYTLDDSVANKTIYMEGINKWINAYYGYVFSTHDLVTSHLLMGLSHVYDWMYSDLSTETRDKVRLLIVNNIRWIRSPTNTGFLVGANQWRDREFGTNHNWYNHHAQAAAAVALWGESGQPNGADADEPELWLNTAIRNFYKVQSHLNADGALTEGNLYSDYGMFPYLDFGSIVDNLLVATSKMPPITGCDAIKNIGKVRLHTLLPNKFGFRSWSDGGWKYFDDFWMYYFTASKFNDKYSQTVAKIMESRSLSPNWRAMFYFDPSIATLPLEEVPKSLDCTDLNLFTARNAWSGNQNFFSFKCGHAVGKSVNARYPNECTGHNQPDPNSFDFWWNDFPIVTNPGYQKNKNTSDYSYTRIVAVSDGKEVMQSGGNGETWFRATGPQGYWTRLDSAVTLEVKHEEDYHAYLGESGGMYKMGGTKCGYRRRAVYFPSGAVVIADRINTPAAANLSFRFLTPIPNLSLAGNVFSFNVGGTNGTITDYSPAVDNRTITTTVVPTWNASEVTDQRRTAAVTKNNVTNAYFGAVINMGTNKISITKIDASGITVQDNNGASYSFKWDADTDAEAPTAPTNLRATKTEFASVGLAWDAPTDNIAVSGYKVYKSGVFEKKVGTTSATVTGLTEKTEYVFTVTAIDNSNESVKSSALNITTLEAPADTEAPTTPQNLAVTNYTRTTCDLTWGAATDNVLVTGYNLYVDGTFVKYVESETTGTLENLSPSTLYSVTVKAKDYNGNLSAASSPVTIRTSNFSANPAAWLFTAIPNQEGTFTVEYDAVPQTGANNSLMAFSRGNTTVFGDLALIVRFSSAGVIDVRNAGTYTAATPFAYVALAKYHFRLSVNVAAKKYSVWVTAPGGTETLLASDYAFRSEQSSVASLAYFVSQTSGAGDQDITNFTLGGQKIKVTQKVTFPTMETKRVGDAPFLLEATSSSGLKVSYASSDTTVAIISGDRVTIVGGGTATITASQAGNDDYTAAADNPQELFVAKINQTIAFDSIATKKFGDAPFALSATATSGLATSYASSDTTVATVSGDRVTIVGAGTATITASQVGNGNYYAAADAEQELVVGKADQTITFQALAAKKYGDAPFTLAATATSGLATSYVSSDTTVATVSGNQVTIVGVGSATITASQAGNGNYNAAADASQGLVVGKGDQTIAFETLAAKKFGDALFTLAATTNSGLAISYASSDRTVATVSGNQVTIVGVGSATITASQAGNENYNASADAKQELVVGKGDQTITFQALAAKKFGDAPFTLAAATNLGLAISYASSDRTVATVSGNQVTIVGAGIATITASQVGNGNYNAAADVRQELVVGKGDQTITFQALAAKKFGDAPFTLAATTTSGLAISYASSDRTIATLSGNQVTIVGAGIATITASQVGNGNYNAAADASQGLVVGKGDQAITFATLADKIMTDAAFRLSATASSGLAIVYTASNDKVTISGSEVTLAKAGRTTITASQGGNTNYNAAVAVQRGFCIKPAKPTVSVSITNPAAPLLTSSAAQGNQWYLNGNPIAGATSASYQAAQSGTYKVQATADDCTSEFSADQVLVITSSKEPLFGGVTVFPNPVKDWLTVRFNDGEGQRQLHVFEANGRQLADYESSAEEARIDVRDYAPGLYFIKVRSGSSISVMRFVKQ